MIKKICDVMIDVGLLVAIFGVVTSNHLITFIGISIEVLCLGTMIIYTIVKKSNLF